MVEGKKKESADIFFPPSVKTYLTFTYNTQRHHHERCIFPLEKKFFFFPSPSSVFQRKNTPVFCVWPKGAWNIFFFFFAS